MGANGEAAFAFGGDGLVGFEGGFDPGVLGDVGDAGMGGEGLVQGEGGAAVVGGGIAFAGGVEVVEEVDEEDGGEGQGVEGKVGVRGGQVLLAEEPPLEEVFGGGLVCGDGRWL